MHPLGTGMPCRMWVQPVCVLGLTQCVLQKLMIISNVKKPADFT
jgi:hypothetical protein